MSHGPKTQRPRETFKQTYRRDSFIKKEKLPETLPYLTPGCKIEAMELKAAGTLLWNGRKLEFQDVRIYVSPAPCKHEAVDAHSGRCITCHEKVAVP
jgi:hypothetical protein